MFLSTWDSTWTRTPTFPVEDEPGSAAPQRLVSGGGNDVAVLERRRHHAGRHQAADVRHVGHQVGAVLNGDLLHAGVVKVPGVAAGPCG